MEFFAILFVAYEIISILKNMYLCGLPVKKIWQTVKAFLQKYTDELPTDEEAEEPETLEEVATQEEGAAKYGEKIVSLLGEQARADMAKTGILASLTTAQGILESGYGTRELAVNANNIFGMKAELSGNNWPSDWGGQTYTKETNEQKPNGEVYTITAAFRKYESMAESIKDHSDYLTGAKKGNDLRYAGLVGERDYKKAIQIVKAGGYATDDDCVSKICSIIEKWNLTQYDTQEAGQNMNIKIIDATMKKSPCLTGGRTIKPIGPYLHSIGCPCEKAMNIINNENRADAGAGVHAVIQHTGEVYVGTSRSIRKRKRLLETGMAAADRREVVIIPISA